MSRFQPPRPDEFGFLVRPEHRFFVPTCRPDDVVRRRRQGWPSLQSLHATLSPGHALTAASTASDSPAIGCRFNGCYDLRAAFAATTRGESVPYLTGRTGAENCSVRSRSVMST